MIKKLLTRCLLAVSLGTTCADEINKPTLKSESQALAQYDGIVGNNPGHKTISNTGVAMEFMSNAMQSYVFFSQTLANGFYYEARGYLRDNYMADNPLVTIPVSDISNPWGYGFTAKTGYNFHIDEDFNITPYLRLNAYQNMGPVYSDNKGDYINSTTYAYLIGTKIAIRVAPRFTPYVDVFGGYQQTFLTGSFPNGLIGSTATISGMLNQWVITYEIGSAIKLSQHLSLIPYWQYITQQDNPDETALEAINQGGFGISPLTGTQQVYGLKFNIAW